MKLSCCLHQLWLTGLSGLCSDAVWECRRYSNKAMWVNWSESYILYLCPSLLGDPDISITPCPRYVLCWPPGIIRAKKLLEQSFGKGINANTQQVSLLCAFTDYEWSLYLETLTMLSIQITQSEGSKIYKLWRFKGWNEETHQQIIFDKFCSSSGGKWKGPLKRNEMDKNTDIYFLWGIKAQNFPLFFQVKCNLFLLIIITYYILIHSSWRNSECKLTHVSVLFCYPSLCLAEYKMPWRRIIIL